jgi:hypothetical protein
VAAKGRGGFGRGLEYGEAVQIDPKRVYVFGGGGSAGLGGRGVVL